MAQLLVNVLFSILKFIANLILSPVLALVSAVIPSFSEFTGAITDFISMGLTYIGFVINLLMIPTWIIQILVTLCVSIFTFTLAIKSVSLVMGIWKIFKP